MTQKEIEYIINSDLPSHKKSELIKGLYDAEHNGVSFCKEGGEVKEVDLENNEQFSLNTILNSNISDSAKEEIQKAFGVQKDLQGAQITITIETSSLKDESPFNASPMTITIGGKSYDVRIADTDEARRIGLSKETSLDDDEGMLFVFEEPIKTPFTMKDTSIDLDIIFIDEDGEVIEVHSVDAHDEKPVECNEEFVYVLEVNKGSGIKEGDELSIDGDDFTEEDKKQVNGRMLVLDENGDVQMRLQGGERIVSIRSTKRLLKLALKAYKNETDADYRRVGRFIMKEFIKQDNTEPQYVQAPEKKGEKDDE